MRVLYARNMRKPLGFGDDIAGDYVRLGVLKTSGVTANNSSLQSLAIANRELLLQPLDDKYTKECQWFTSIGNFHPGGRPNSDFLSDKLAAVATNWSSFPYERILFDDSEACEVLIAPPKFSTNVGLFAYVGFKGCGSDRKLTILVCSIYAPLEDVLKKIGDETGLFSISQQSNL